MGVAFPLVGVVRLVLALVKNKLIISSKKTEAKGPISWRGGSGLSELRRGGRRGGASGQGAGGTGSIVGALYWGGAAGSGGPRRS